MKVSTDNQLYDALLKSKLLTEEQVGTLREEIAADSAQEIAKELVRRDLLTKWQAGRLLSGGRNFFLGKYKLMEKLEDGSFRANHVSMRREVTVKLMPPQVSKNPKTLKRFQHEVAAASACCHPNVVASFDAGSQGDVLFLVMEHADGRNLTDWMAEYDQFPLDWACECMRQAAAGLHHLHEQELVHRDVGPNSIIVDDDGSGTRLRVKISNLGADQFQEDHVDCVAPETVGKGACSPLADQYALGTVLFRLVTGTVPFPEGSREEKLKARKDETVP
ncbi:MAG: serine/threonine protein kinase, partial [Planctomycetales bacterium]